VLRSPAAGLTTASEGVASRTGLRKAQQGAEEAGRERRPHDGRVEAHGRPGRAKNRFEAASSGQERLAGEFASEDPSPSKNGGGEDDELTSGLPVCNALSQACRRGAWLGIKLLGTLLFTPSVNSADLFQVYPY
jgi:hypothetical protein